MISIFRLLKRKVINKLPHATQLTIHTNEFNNMVDQVLNEISTKIINANDMEIKFINVFISVGHQMIFTLGADITRSYITVPSHIFNNTTGTSFVDMCNIIELKLNSLGYKTRHIAATGDGGTDLRILTIHWGF